MRSTLLDPASLGDLLLYRLGRLYATAGTMTLRVCEGEFGITRRQWRLLALLAEAGPLQPSVLAERAELDRARTSRALSSLVGQGLVEREALARDRRLALVQLSARGRALHQRMFPRIAAINRSLLAPLEATQVRRLDALLDALQGRAATLLAEATWPKANRRRGRRAGD
jgi:DNA-binding MarR family transcriptional regulator